MTLYESLIRQIENAQCYDSLTKPVDDAIIAFDERVRLEDMIKHRYLAMIREADDRTFASLVRRVRNSRPRWMARGALTETINEELSLRLLIAKVSQLG